ncbi:MAG: indolepyruvate ferredoxin oxidoreductase family protein, partial [Burkholderiales bacterium]|nr:indolepyruvate ferredoxin oxidoreductase family protein [Burkholderiales bacterium]
GDCGVASNCVSVSPLETEFGRKRTIDQSTCNKDYSCVKGFCPSFVTVHGGELKKGKGVPVGDNVDTLFAVVPEPKLPVLDGAYAVLVNGIGGTGVVTIGAIVGMAAHLEGKAFNALDMAGLAQKGGAVWSHLQIAREQSDIGAARIGLGGAKVMIGCDFVTSASETSMEMLRYGQTFALVNLHQQMTGEFTRNINAQFPAAALEETIAKGVGEGNAQFIDGTRIATALMGNSIATNMFMLGMAYQNGLIPIGSEAINKAIELNGVAVKM